MFAGIFTLGCLPVEKICNIGRIRGDFCKRGNDFLAYLCSVEVEVRGAR